MKAILGAGLILVVGCAVASSGGGAHPTAAQQPAPTTTPVVQVTPDVNGQCPPTHPYKLADSIVVGPNDPSDGRVVERASVVFGTVPPYRTFRAKECFRDKESALTAALQTARLGGTSRTSNPVATIACEGAQPQVGSSGCTSGGASDTTSVAWAVVFFFLGVALAGGLANLLVNWYSARKRNVMVAIPTKDGRTLVRFDPENQESVTNLLDALDRSALKKSGVSISEDRHG
jgi:hypothetical protein